MGLRGTSTGWNDSLGIVPGSPEESVCMVLIFDSKQPTEKGWNEIVSQQVMKNNEP